MAQLLICAIMVWPLRHTLAREVTGSIDAYQTHGKSLRPRPIPFTLDRSQSSPRIRVADPNLVPLTPEGEIPGTFTTRLWGPALLNLPAGLAGLSFSIAFEKGRAWVPRGMGLQTWRAISWPLIALILWWIAGRAIESLIAASRGISQPTIARAELIVGIAIQLMGMFALLAPIEADVRNEPELPWVFLSLAGALWALLGTTIIAARISQRRMARRYNPH